MEHRWLNRSVETAQRRVEQQHFAVRKRTLEYDDVMNKQRSVVYQLRHKVLMGSQEQVHGLVLDVMNDLVYSQSERYLFSEKDGQLGDFMAWLGVTFPITVAEDEIKPFMGNPEAAAEYVMKRVEQAYETKCASEDQATLPYMERGVFLQVIDREWQDYLRAMDDLRHGVNLRAYGQRDPLVEYKKEAFGMFESLMSSIKSKVVSSQFRCATATRLQAAYNRLIRTNAESFDLGSGSSEGKELTVGDVLASMREENAMSSAQNKELSRLLNVAVNAPRPATGRNDPCPCGSGKKFKKCCGRNEL